MGTWVDTYIWGKKKSILPADEIRAFINEIRDQQLLNDRLILVSGRQPIEKACASPISALCWYEGKESCTAPEGATVDYEGHSIDELMGSVSTGLGSESHLLLCLGAFNYSNERVAENLDDLCVANADVMLFLMKDPQKVEAIDFEMGDHQYSESPAFSCHYRQERPG